MLARDGGHVDVAIVTNAVCARTRCCNAARDGGRVVVAIVKNAVCVITLCLNAARDGGRVVGSHRYKCRMRYYLCLS